LKLPQVGELGAGKSRAMMMMAVRRSRPS
jgi:hypothetical protein